MGWVIRYLSRKICQQVYPFFIPSCPLWLACDLGFPICHGQNVDRTQLQLEVTNRPVAAYIDLADGHTGMVANAFFPSPCPRVSVVDFSFGFCSLVLLLLLFLLLSLVLLCPTANRQEPIAKSPFGFANCQLQPI